MLLPVKRILKHGVAAKIRQLAQKLNGGTHRLIFTCMYVYRQHGTYVLSVRMGSDKEDEMCLIFLSLQLSPLWR
jgi:hypothetical protein